MTIKTCLLIVATLLAAAGCSKPGPPPKPAPPKPVVYTTFYPTTYLAERIANGAVEVRCPLPDGADPATWQPGPEIIASYQQAAVIVLNGASFEQWPQTASLPESRVVDTAAALAPEQLLEYDADLTHSHDPAGDHSHRGIDGHIWLDPILAIEQARAIEKAMTAAFPEHAAAFIVGYAALESDLKALDQSLQNISAVLGGIRVLSAHPAYNYLSRRYDWNIINVDLDITKPVTEADLDIVQARIGNNPEPTLILWESEPPQLTINALRRHLGIKSVVFSPIESKPTDADYLKAMYINIRLLEEALRL